MLRRVLLLLMPTVLLTPASPVAADLIISSLGSTTTIDFESTLTGSNIGQFSGAGFEAGTSTSGRLDSNAWKVTGLSDGNLDFGGTGTSGDYARGTDNNSATTAGIYAFDATADGGSMGLGVQPAGSDFTPGSLTLRLRNETGGNVTSFDIGYDLRVYNDQNRANSLNFEYSFDDTNYTQVSFFDYISDEAAAGTASWNLEFSKSTTLSGLNLANGDNLYFRWVGDDVSGGGSRDQFHIDNIDIAFNAAAVPEPASLGLLLTAAGGFYLLRRKKEKGQEAEKGV